MLEEQLQSFVEQTHTNWLVIASDDGSTDQSRERLDRFAKSYPLQRLAGPQKGVTQNFLFLMRQMPVYAPNSSWLAFSDQDDVWLEHRLQRGIDALQRVANNQPALYCSRTWETDANLNKRRVSRRRPRSPGFQNALVQNIAAGNTILLNEAGTKLVQKAAKEIGNTVVHDWWVYQVISGGGGKILHDDTPTLLYRQHGSNLIGANNSLKSRLSRIWKVLSGVYRQWNDINVGALEACSDYLTIENQTKLNEFVKLRQSGLIQRTNLMRALGLYRQSVPGTLSLWISVIFKRL